jgi:thiol-disulfide isomerase/thioredoxin
MQSVSVDNLPKVREGPSLVYFSSPHCPHCVKAAPQVEKFYQALKSAQKGGEVNTDIIMVSFDVNNDQEGKYTQDVPTVPRLVLELPSQEQPLVIDLKSNPEDFVRHVADNSEAYLPPPTLSMASFISEYV